MNKKYLIFFIFLFSLNFIFALSIGDEGEDGVNFRKPTIINYSQYNVNNSDYLDGHDSSEFVPYTGATQDVDLGSKIIKTNRITSNNDGLDFSSGSESSKYIRLYNDGIDRMFIPLDKDIWDLGWTSIYSWRNLWLNRTAYIGNIIINGTNGNITANSFNGLWNGSVDYINKTLTCYYNGTNCQATSLNPPESRDDSNMVTRNSNGTINYRNLENEISLLDTPHGQFGLYTPTTNNLLYAGDKRFTVTGTNFEYFASNTLFDGNYDQYFWPSITANNTVAMISINFTSKNEYTAPNGVSYPYGWVYVHFYGGVGGGDVGNNISNVTARLLTKNGGALAWRSYVNGTNVATNTTKFNIYKIPLTANYQAFAMEINISVGTQNTGSDPDYMISVSEVEFIVSRSADKYAQPVLNKNLENSLYQPILFKDSNNIIRGSINTLGAFNGTWNESVNYANLNQSNNFTNTTNKFIGNVYIISGATNGTNPTSVPLAYQNTFSVYENQSVQYDTFSGITLGCGSKDCATGLVLRNDVQTWWNYNYGADSDMYCVYDITNSKVPFKIRPNTATDSLVLANNRIGIRRGNTNSLKDAQVTINSSDAPQLELMNDTKHVNFSVDGLGNVNIKSTNSGSRFNLSNMNLSAQGVRSGDYYSNDGNKGITSSSYFICLDDMCSYKCQLIIENGLIVDCMEGA